MRSSDQASVTCSGVPRRERGTEVRLVSVAAAVTAAAGPLQLRVREGRSCSVPARALVPAPSSRGLSPTRRAPGKGPRRRPVQGLQELRGTSRPLSRGRERGVTG